MVGLTFDWDGVGLEDKKVQHALDSLTYEFGQGNVWYRISSSGTGLHIIIGTIQLIYWQIMFGQIMIHNGIWAVRSGFTIFLLHALEHATKNLQPVLD